MGFKTDIIWIGLLVILPLFLLSYEIWTGNILLQTFNSIFRKFYVIIMQGYILLAPFTLTISPEWLLVSILILGFPQMLVYGYKTGTKSEFTHGKLKLLIRVLFITAYFFSLLLIRIRIIVGLVLILSCSILFIRLRQFSKYRVEAKEANYILRSAMDLRNSSQLSKFLINFDLFNEKGVLTFRSRRGKGSLADIIKRIIQILLILFLIVVGFIVISTAVYGTGKYCSDCASCGDCCTGC